MDDRPIAYEPHPVTPERKAELRGMGFRIVDAAFKPREVQSPPDLDLSKPAEPAPRRGRPSKA